MYTYIEMTCTDQVLSIVTKPKVASGGVEEDRLRITFSDEWDGFQKTAIFYRSNDTVYSEVLDENDECFVPAFVLQEPGTVYISVYGEKGNVIRTTDVTKYKIVQGAVTDTPDPLALYKQQWTEQAQRSFSVLVKVLANFFCKEVRKNGR